VAAEIRRGKEEEERKKETTGQKYHGLLSVLAYECK